MVLLVSKGVDKETAVAAAIISRGVPQWAGMGTGVLSLAFMGSATPDMPEAPPAKAS